MVVPVTHRDPEHDDLAAATGVLAAVGAVVIVWTVAGALVLLVMVLSGHSPW